MTPARLVVFAGRPGTGKTTLSRLVAADLRAALLRVDVVETAMLATGLDAAMIGPAGYQLVHQLAEASLQAGGDVVIDAVNPVPEARAGWLGLADVTETELFVIEAVLPDADEHRRRVEQRRPDLPGQHVPSWDNVVAGEYVAWDVERDGQRLAIDTSDSAGALAAIRHYLSV